MTLLKAWAFLLYGALFLYQTDARRIRVQESQIPQAEEEQETVNYYAAEPQEDDQGRRVVLVSAADRYNGLYGQQSVSPRSGNNYITRGSPKAQETRVKEEPKSPPVQTLRNYNKVNDDGSFTFGYEAADGSFKEETRGTDCVVRGKYGYVDPDGNKREFTYVSGNPCDPNAPKDQDDSEDSNETENENVPANYPTRPIQPINRPVVPKPPVTLFQNTYAQEEEQPEPEQLLRPTPQPARRPIYISRPQYAQHSSVNEEYQRPSIQPTTTPTPVVYRSNLNHISITPRPVTPTLTSRTPQLRATTYKPQLLQYAVSPTPTIFTKQSPLSYSTESPNGNADFEQEFQRFQQGNNIASSTPSYPTTVTVEDPTSKRKPVDTLGQIYSTALVYDPTTGQYNSNLYQRLPQGGEDLQLKQKIQAYVQSPRPEVLNIQQFQQQRPLYSQNLRTQSSPNSQAAYQAQQAELQFQNSAQLFAQQQRVRTEQQQQQARQPPVYYIQPSLDNTGALGTSQIDAFLRGHNIQF